MRRKLRSIENTCTRALAVCVVQLEWVFKTLQRCGSLYMYFGCKLLRKTFAWALSFVWLQVLHDLSVDTRGAWPEFVPRANDK